MADGTGDEHRVEIPVRGSGQGKVAAPERHLNGFVHSVAVIERFGNALGTLAFTWATVVLLGGYPTVLRTNDDFWFATTIVFLEAARMFTRNNRHDFQLFFRTRGAFRLLGWNGLLMAIVYFSVIMVLLRKYVFITGTEFIAMAILLAIGLLLSPAVMEKLMCNSLRHAITLWSPMIAILLMCPSILDIDTRSSPSDSMEMDKGMNTTWSFMNATEKPVVINASVRIIKKNSETKWMAYIVLLFLPVLLVTISRLRYPSVKLLVHSAIGSKLVFWRRVIQNVCMLAAIVMSVLIYPSGYHFTSSKLVMILYQVSALVVVSFGNLQIPAAVVRVVLALLRLKERDYSCVNNSNKPSNLCNPDNWTNLDPSLNIFYGMVLGQGILYIVACMLEVFSFIPRRYLIRSAGFRGQLGAEYVNLYYAYAFEKCMGGSVLAPKKTSLINFAMDSLESDSPKMQLYGVQTLHIFLESDYFKVRLLSKLTSSVKTLPKLIKMLGWTSPNYSRVRLFAAKVTAELAKNLQIDTIPGTMQLVSGLLDSDTKRKRGNTLLDTDDDQEERKDIVPNNVDNQENQEGKQDTIHDTHNIVGTSTQLTLVESPTQSSCRVLIYWQRISEFWSIPKKQPLSDQDLLPVLGMSIIGNLSSCNQGNQLEISKATDLIPKIICFTIYRSGTTYTETQQKILMEASLKVLQSLSSIDGEAGMTLRYNISNNLFLLRNLAEILRDSTGSQKWRKLVARILRNLAIDRDTRHEIGRSQLIMSRLTQAFLNSNGSSSTNDERLLRKAAGQALAMLSIECVYNCLVMLKEPGFVEKLKTMILLREDKYIVAASLLRNLCLHAQPELKVSDMEALSHTMREVLERVMDTEGAELEVLIGLSSQICRVIPEGFVLELENDHIKQRFVKRLVDTLNANVNPSACCPGIRRVILEQAICMMECNSSYANYFKECNMMEALSLVEETHSNVENYMLFLGNTGFMKYNTPFVVLVDRAKDQLMGQRQS